MTTLYNIKHSMRQTNMVSSLLFLLVAAMTVHTTLATSGVFKKLNTCNNITGNILREVISVSGRECSFRCLKDDECGAFHYEIVGRGKCLLIEEGSGTTFYSTAEHSLYKRGLWVPPSGYCGPLAVKYWSFDTKDGLRLMKATANADYPLISGKKGNALTFFHTDSRWVDLGIHTDACMTRPDTCTNGGAVALWYRGTRYGGDKGILTTRTDSVVTSIMIYLTSSELEVHLRVTSGLFHIAIPGASVWTHFVLNYLGPNNGEGIKMYHNGTEEASDTVKNPNSYPQGDGRVVVGRLFTDRNNYYASVDVDEVMFFNQFLTNTQISLLANM